MPYVDKDIHDPNDACASHGAISIDYTHELIWGIISYPYSNGCLTQQQYSPHHDFSIDNAIDVSTHELFEAVSDPTAQGWFRTDPYTGEIGDLCINQYGTYVITRPNQTWNGDGYVIQEMWDNATGACELGGP